MKKLSLIVALLLMNVANAQKEEVQKTIETFFEGFHANDTIKIKLACSDKLVLQSILESPKGNKFIEDTAKEFYASVAKIPAEAKFEERLLSYNIQIDGSLAHVWAPYEFYFNGKLSHKGVNAFTLYKDNGQWKIVHLIDTRRK
jgi:hypothetical protein